MSGPDGERWTRLSAILDQLLDVPPDERASRLAGIDEEDAALGQELRALLALGASHGLLDRPYAHGLATMFEEAASEGAPELELVGPWRLVRELGRGGMGVVYLAERADGQYEQQSALKLIKRGLDTEEVVARFRRERQILARLRHPAIAQLLDGGVAADGRPYFAMEYVEGRPITEFCDQRRLTIDERLGLFLRVCDAVQHAHRSLVVHRDLKPSNILVTDDGALKLLDFGIAKLLGGEETSDATEWTRLGRLAMTPGYAAPEQVRGEPVTTATDVYAMGVVLYELLSGRRPYRLPGGLAAEAERILLEAAPARPSVVVEAEVEEGTPRADERARARSSSPAGLRRRLKGDVDAITLTALRKEPERRYPTVQALADDLRRHLSGQPVSARPESRSYRVGKFAHRNRVGVAATLIVVLALVCGLVATAWQGRQRARETRKAQEIKDFVLEILGALAPERARGGEVDVRKLLDGAARRVETELAKQPLLQAELETILADLYHKLGAHEQALPLVVRGLVTRRALLGPLHPEVGTSLRLESAVLTGSDRLDEAQEAIATALEIHRQSPGPESVEVADDVRPVDLQPLPAELVRDPHPPGSRRQHRLLRDPVHREVGVGVGDRGDDHRAAAALYGLLDRVAEPNRPAHPDLLGDPEPDIELVLEPDLRVVRVVAEEHRIAAEMVEDGSRLLPRRGHRADEGEETGKGEGEEDGRVAEAHQKLLWRTPLPGPGDPNQCFYGYITLRRGQVKSSASEARGSGLSNWCIDRIICQMVPCGAWPTHRRLTPLNRPSRRSPRSPSSTTTPGSGRSSRPCGGRCSAICRRRRNRRRAWPESSLSRARG